MQSELVWQETLTRLLWLAPKGAPGAARCQVVPFQCSASVMRLTAPLWCTDPVAVHEVAELQDTLDRKLSLLPVRFGVVCTPQLEPFQREASVTPLVAL